MADSTCSVDGCDNSARARGWCKKHYQKWVKYGDPLAVRLHIQGTCTIDGCNAPHRSRGYCESHYRRGRRCGDPLAAREFFSGTTCRIDGCEGNANEPGAARGWCRKHYTNWQRHGDPTVSAACAGCGSTIGAGTGYKYCMRAECRRLARIEKRARDIQRGMVSPAKPRPRQSVAERREARAAYRARTDRKCVRPGCAEFAIPGVAYCRPHNNERAAKRHARLRLRLPRVLFERQNGLCPDTDHGGCGLPLGSADGHHVDHLIPIARNGPDDDWNLQLMHSECNLSKLDRLVPAAVAAASLHDIMLIEPDGSRRRTKPSCLLP